MSDIYVKIYILFYLLKIDVKAAIDSSKTAHNRPAKANRSYSIQIQRA
jgi:hypothetical protein